MNTFFSDKIILWRKMTKIWLKIWLKVKENGTKKNQIGENGGERKKILVRTLNWDRLLFVLGIHSYFQWSCIIPVMIKEFSPF